MKEISLRNLTVMALVASCFIQIGAQLFAVSMIASTVAAAPPRSFAILQGEYGYDSQAFWAVVPNITLLLFVLALITNWKTARRNLLLAALGLFVAAGLLAMLFLGPTFDRMIARGFSDEIDPVLQSEASTWLMMDWSVWGLGLLAGLLLLIALIRPVASHPISPQDSHPERR